MLLAMGCSGNGPSTGDSGPTDAERDTSTQDAPADRGNDSGLLGAGAACSSGQSCASGFCVDQVCCESACGGTCMACSMAKTGRANGVCEAVSESTDPDAECDGPCLLGTCSAGQCAIRPDGTECRAATDVCDLVEVCAAGQCPVDALAPSGMTCRAAVGPCDATETCDGSSASCATDLLVASTQNVPACSPYACPGNGTECRTGCTSNSHCGSGSFCIANGCVRARRIFVTSSAHNGNLGGLAGADAICQTRATTAGLSGTFRAWLSDTTTSLASRINQYAGPYYRVDTGEQPGVYMLASDWNDLASGLNVFAIATDENGASSGSGTFAWTGTSTAGSIVTPNCQNWTSSAAQESGRRGWTSAADTQWSSHSESSCDTLHRLYCIETIPND